MRSSISRHIVAPLFALTFLLSSTLLAQRPAPTTQHVAVPPVAPRPEDVATLDGIMKAFYLVISAPAGQPRQWSRDRTLYIDGMRFVATAAQDGKVFARVMDHQSYVDWVNDDMVRNGFFEREIHRVTKAFGNITHVFSTYESRHTGNGPVTERGHQQRRTILRRQTLVDRIGYLG
jgi:hypothetical protein